LNDKVKNEIVRNLDCQDLTDQVDLMLPEVPHKSDHDPTHMADVSGEDIDEQIRKRLTKLQFFSKAWAHNSSNSVPLPIKLTLKRLKRR
jgi:hypothetical protein